jgi:hypothetical protein
MHRRRWSGQRCRRDPALDLGQLPARCRASLPGSRRRSMTEPASPGASSARPIWNQNHHRGGGQNLSGDRIARPHPQENLRACKIRYSSNTGFWPAAGRPFQIFPPLAVEVHKLWPGQPPRRDDRAARGPQRRAIWVILFTSTPAAVMPYIYNKRQR